MTRIAHRFSIPLAAASVASSLLFGLAPRPALAEASCPTLGLPPAIEQRLLEKASQGIDALREYIEASEAVNQLTVEEVVAWIDARRAANCL